MTRAMIQKLGIGSVLAINMSSVVLYAQATSGGACTHGLITGTQWALGTVAAGAAFVNLIISAAFAGALAGLNLGLWLVC